MYPNSQAQNTQAPTLTQLLTNSGPLRLAQTTPSGHSTVTAHPHESHFACAAIPVSTLSHRDAPLCLGFPSGGTASINLCVPTNRRARTATCNATITRRAPDSDTQGFHDVLG